VSEARVSGGAVGVDAIEVAERLFTAISEGDLDVVGSILADDVTVWTNFDQRTVDRERALRTIGWLVRTIDGLHYDVVERIATPKGFVQRHVLRGKAPNGTEVAMPACIVAEVAADGPQAGRVTSMAEYADPSPMTAALS
jgi:ketosteroid isomerase-like protein